MLLESQTLTMYEFLRQWKKRSIKTPFAKVAHTLGKSRNHISVNISTGNFELKRY